MARAFTLITPTPADWRRMRELRLRMVADTPIAYLERLDDLLQVDDAEWQERAGRNLGPDTHRVVAVDSDGRWIASMVVFISEGLPAYLGRGAGGARRANLVGVFVDPAWRGDAGVTDAVLRALDEWVRLDRGLHELYLHVSLENPRAIRAYEKRGFVDTGARETIPGDLSGADMEMVARLPLPSTL